MWLTIWNTFLHKSKYQGYYVRCILRRTVEQIIIIIITIINDTLGQHFTHIYHVTAEATFNAQVSWQVRLLIKSDKDCEDQKGNDRKG